jgi:hypothetical protein
MAAMHQPLVTRLLLSGVVIGAVLFAIGGYIAARDAGCDAGSCPSDSAVAAAKVLIPTGGALFAVTSIALGAWLVGHCRSRRRDRSARQHKPSLREW